MPDDSPDLIDIEAVVARQRTERFRVVVLHGEPCSGKTGVARRLAKKLGGEYIDLLEQFAGDSSLSAAVPVFGAEQLRDFILSRSAGPWLLVVDNPDFLLATWTEREKDRLRAALEMTNRVETERVVVFVMQTDEQITGRQLIAGPGQRRSFSLHDIRNL
jgi:hypothetical protein